MMKAAPQVGPGPHMTISRTPTLWLQARQSSRKPAILLGRRDGGRAVRRRASAGGQAARDRLHAGHWLNDLWIDPRLNQNLREVVCVHRLVPAQLQRDALERSLVIGGELDHLVIGVLDELAR